MELERQVRETAQAMIARYGTAARAHAEFRADVLHHEGEPRAALTWRMIMRQIDLCSTAQAADAA